MKKILIFFPSFTSISQAFSVMAFEGSEAHIRLIISQPDVLKAFQMMKVPPNVEITYLPDLNRNLADAHILRHFWSRYASKRLFKQLIQSGPYEKIYFFSH